jgi:hypothetical protein
MQPEKVLIPHDDYRFECVGRFPHGRQFMAFQTGAFPGQHRVAPKNWQDVKKLIVVIHIFDAKGSHLTTDAHLIGYAREEPQIDAKMDAMYADLLREYKIEDNYLCDIWISSFHTVIDDIYYEFVYEQAADGDEIREQMALWPNDVVFYPPWNDGNYDT